MTNVTHEHNKFLVSFEGKPAGEMLYFVHGNTMNITHTEVSPEFGGKGLGAEMVRAAVEYAREKNLKINPTCPFAKKVLDKNPEWQDVLE